MSTIFSVNHLRSGIWDLGSGIWDLGSGIWDLGSGIWDLCRECAVRDEKKLKKNVSHFRFRVIFGAAIDYLEASTTV